MGSTLNGLLRAVPYAMGKAVQNYQVLDSCYNLGQSICIKKASTDIAFLSRINKIAGYFFVADSISLVTTGIDLLRKISVTYKIAVELFRLRGDFVEAALVFTTTSSLAVITLSTIVLSTTLLINKQFQKYFGQTIPGAKWMNPGTEIAKQTLFTARIVVNIALLYFSPMSPFLAISISSELYSLVKMAQRKWLSVTVERDLKFFEYAAQYADKLRFVYTFLLQTGSSQHQRSTGSDEDCAVCQEGSPNVHFCNTHVFHSNCIQSMIMHSAEIIANRLIVTNRMETEIRHTRNGFYTHSTYNTSYNLEGNQNDLPSCPLCRAQPEHSKASVAVNDIRHGWSPGRIAWVA